LIKRKQNFYYEGLAMKKGFPAVAGRVVDAFNCQKPFQLENM
jgi:hypothetical protein